MKGSAPRVLVLTRPAKSGRRGQRRGRVATAAVVVGALLLGAVVVAQGWEPPRLALDDCATPVTAAANEGPTGEAVWSLAVGADGSVWAGTDREAWHFDGSDWTATPLGKGPAWGQRVSAVAVAADGVTWVGVHGSGVARFDGEVWTTYTTADGLAQFDGRAWTTHLREEQSVRAVTVARDGTVWAGTIAGLLRFDGDEWTRYTSDDGLAGEDPVNAVAIAPDGAVWVGTYAGVSRFDEQRWPAFRRWRTYSDRRWLPHENAESVVAAPDGTIWVGTRLGLVALCRDDQAAGIT